jgi:Cys-rich repeat protein
MPTEDRPRHGDGVEEYSFDELARGIASGTISRSRALKLAGAALLGGGVLSSFFSKEAGAGGATRPRCPRDRRPGCTTRCTGTEEECVCHETTEGRKRCVHACCEGVGGRCRSSADCPSGQVCSKTVRRCCEEAEERPACVTLCHKQSPCLPLGAQARSAGDGG